MMTIDVTIAWSDDPQANVQTVQTILADLPEWFGLPESTQSYIDEAAHLPLWVAKTQGKIIGFIDLNETSSATAEISCMGVLKQYQHLGVGTLLVGALTQFAQQQYQYLQVKTVDEGHYKQYDETIRFYEAMGFGRLEVFPTLWDAWNPCLILVQHLGHCADRDQRETDIARTGAHQPRHRQGNQRPDRRTKTTANDFTRSRWLFAVCSISC